MTFIIAEAGTNHAHKKEERRKELASKLIGAAASAGADAIKFQLFVPAENLFCPLPGDQERFYRWADTMLTRQEWLSLEYIAASNRIDLMFSAFQPSGALFAEEISSPFIKVASRAAIDYPYNRDYCYLISTGFGRPDRSPARYYLMQCEAKYPSTEKWRGEMPGFSDHSGDVAIGLDAIERGVSFLEVHFNIPGCDAGPDAPVCLQPADLKKLCERRNALMRMAS